jgi:hypothetical protein
MISSEVSFELAEHVTGDAGAPPSSAAWNDEALAVSAPPDDAFLRTAAEPGNVTHHNEKMQERTDDIEGE